MGENATCSNKKCPMYGNGFNSNNRNCSNCIYKINTNNIQNLSDVIETNQVQETKTQIQDHPNSFKKTTHDISNLTYNYKEDKSDDFNTNYNSQTHFEDFYKVHKKPSPNLSTKIIVISLGILLIVATLLVISKLFTI